MDRAVTDTTPEGVRHSRGHRGRRWLWLGVPAVLVLLLVLAAVLRPGRQGRTTYHPATVATGDLRLTTAGTGTLQPAR
jgi:ABC-type phosphate transport system auxiliary subunit